MLLDVELQQKMAANIFQVGKMYAMYLKEETPFGLTGMASVNNQDLEFEMDLDIGAAGANNNNNVNPEDIERLKKFKHDRMRAKQQSFIRSLMFDKFFKCNLMMLEETWRSRNLLNREKINRLVRELHDQKDRFEKYQESMD